MQHFIKRFEETAKKDWQKNALCDYRGDEFTYADIATRIAKLHMIFKHVGIKPGDKVALCAKNTARWGMAYLAATSYRAVAVPILNGFSPEMLEKLVVHSDSVVLFTENDMWSKMNPENMPLLKAAVSLDNYSSLWATDDVTKELIDNIDTRFAEKYPNGLNPEDINYEIGEADDIITISYTSGTTSDPKGIMLSVRSISSNITFAVSRIQFPHNDTVVSMLPLAHLYGLAFEFIFPVTCGGCVYFLGKTPTPTILLQSFADVKPYMLITVPLVIEKIFKNKVMPTLEKPVMKVLTSLPFVKNVIYNTIRDKVMTAFGGKMKHIIIGGAAISGSIEKVMKRVHLPYTVGYGMTECGPLIGYEDWFNFVMRSCGKAVDGMEVRIDSENAEEVVGEIQVRGDNVMTGYYKNEEATRASFTEDGWMRTGDLGLIDKEGNIFIKGRSKNMILTENGQNIYPEEIEEILNTMPNVKESIIIERNKHLVALVDADNPAANPLPKKELEAVMESNRVALNQQLPNYAQVVKIEIMDKEFEHTPKNSIKRFMYK